MKFQMSWQHRFVTISSRWRIHSYYGKIFKKMQLNRGSPTVSVFEMLSIPRFKIMSSKNKIKYRAQQIFFKIVILFIQSVTNEESVADENQSIGKYSNQRTTKRCCLLFKRRLKRLCRKFLKRLSQIPKFNHPCLRLRHHRYQLFKKPLLKKVTIILFFWKIFDLRK